MFILGGVSWDLDGGRFSPGFAAGCGGVAFGLWCLSKVDELAKLRLVVAAVAAGVASACTIGPLFGRPVGPVLVAVDGVALAVGLWAGLGGLAELARELPAIRRRFLSIRRWFQLVAAVGAVLLAGRKGWELGGAQPVEYPLEVGWTTATVVILLAFVALQFETFRTFMALRKGAETAVERNGSSRSVEQRTGPEMSHFRQTS